MIKMTLEIRILKFVLLFSGRYLVVDDLKLVAG
jgi:hypothetical protein